LDLLRFEGPATATTLAGRVGESTGSTSYHLRQLARHGFIEEAAKREGRERWWRYRERRSDIAGNVDRASARTLLGELLSREAYALDRYLSTTVRDPEWDDAAFFQTKALRLTTAELKELSRMFDAALERFHSAARDDVTVEALPVRVLAFGFPQPGETP
jgi:DNA-binding transcriptional ArsR family regulator